MRAGQRSVAPANRAARAATPHASRSRNAPRAGRGASGDPRSSATHRSSRATSAALCQRSSGSFARHVLTTRSRDAGHSGWIAGSGGGFEVRIDAARLARVVPENALRPAAISYSVAPSAKMSVRASAARPSSCSGAMYCGVPTTAPSTVSDRSSVVSTDGEPSAFSGAIARARPKSRSLAPDFVSMTLPGLRSRWTIPLRCAASRAAAISAPHRMTSGRGIGPRSSRAASVSPSTSSMTRRWRVEEEEEEEGISSNE